ncbi:processed acidic surface protein [Anaerobacillus sp. MEB173]|uniref:processed acidic surface protein n=1 Tax=Anaerobacillus sp. MEB173 TaxID=3383345 RepID=UPI003F916D62
MKTILKVIIASFLIFFGTNLNVLAAPPQAEVNQLISDMNWSMEELEEYLAFYELTLDDFESTEELQMMLGTPITQENLNELLQEYDLTHEELEALLDEFGESLDDYHFIEDLDLAIDFYLNHEGEMLEIEEFLAKLGLTDEEVERLFTHLLSLDETVLETEMERIASRFEPYMTIDDPAQLSEAQQQELFGLFEEMLAAFHLKASFYLVDGEKTPISYQELTQLEELDGRSLLIELYDLQGNLILDMLLSADMLTSDFLFETGEELIHIGDMAGELTNELHDGKLPNTASPYWLNLIIGLFLILGGVTFYRISRKLERA